MLALRSLALLLIGCQFLVQGQLICPSQPASNACPQLDCPTLPNNTTDIASADFFNAISCWSAQVNVQFFAGCGTQGPLLASQVNFSAVPTTSPFVPDLAMSTGAADPSSSSLSSSSSSSSSSNSSIVAFAQLAPGLGMLPLGVYSVKDAWTIASDVLKDFEVLIQNRVSESFGTSVSNGGVTFFTLSTTLNTTYHNLVTNRCVDVLEIYFQTFDGNGNFAAFGYETDSLAVWCSTQRQPVDECAALFKSCPTTCPYTPVARSATGSPSSSASPSKTAAPTSTTSSSSTASPASASQQPTSTQSASTAASPICSQLPSTPNANCPVVDCPALNSTADWSLLPYDSLFSTVNCWLTRLDIQLYADCGALGPLPPSQVNFSAVAALPLIEGFAQVPPSLGLEVFGLYSLEQSWTAGASVFANFEVLSSAPVNELIGSSVTVITGISVLTVSDSYNTTYHNLVTDHCITVFETFFQSFDAEGRLASNAYATDSLALWCSTLRYPVDECAAIFVPCPTTCPSSVTTSPSTSEAIQLP